MGDIGYDPVADFKMMNGLPEVNAYAFHQYGWECYEVLIDRIQEDDPIGIKRYIAHNCARDVYAFDWEYGNMRSQAPVGSPAYEDRSKCRYLFRNKEDAMHFRLRYG